MLCTRRCIEPVTRSADLMEPRPTCARHLIEVHASFNRTGRQRGRDIGPSATVGPGARYSVCQGLDSCVDETRQELYTDQTSPRYLARRCASSTRDSSTRSLTSS